MKIIFCLNVKATKENLSNVIDKIFTNWLFVFVVSWVLKTNRSRQHLLQFYILPKLGNIFKLLLCYINVYIKGKESLYAHYVFLTTVILHILLQYINISINHLFILCNYLWA